MRLQQYIHLFIRAGAMSCLCLLVITTGRAAAITAIPTPKPTSGSYGLEATKTQPAPTQGATITVPGNGASYSVSPTKVSGICPAGLLVLVYNNGVMVGSVQCSGGSFSIDVSLFVGNNELSASVFDDLDQTGPDSNKVTVSYSNATFTAFGTLITLTSNYGRRAANPGTQLSWPLILQGGNGPYAFSIDWGDGTPSDLKSQALAGDVAITHVYQKSGVYHVTVKVTDANGVTAFLQLTAVANGAVAASNTDTKTTKTVVVTKMLWIPMILPFVLLFPTYWLGRKSELVTLHKQLQKTVETYKET